MLSHPGSCLPASQFHLKYLTEIPSCPKAILVVSSEFPLLPRIFGYTECFLGVGRSFAMRCESSRGVMDSIVPRGPSVIQKSKTEGIGVPSLTSTTFVTSPYGRRRLGLHVGDSMVKMPNNEPMPAESMHLKIHQSGGEYALWERRCPSGPWV